MSIRRIWHGRKAEEIPDVRLARIGKRLMTALRQDPEFGPDVRAILLISDAEKGVQVAAGFDTQADATRRMLEHVSAMAAVLDDC